MREILFRGKTKDGRWVEGNAFIPTKGGETCIVEQDAPFHSNVYEVIPETVGQYTGLTDKNGTRIFEGDIVRYENYEPFYDRSYLTKDKVVFADGEFTPIPKQYNCEDDYYSYEFRNFEVIGNIYDNPELLKN